MRSADFQDFLPLIPTEGAPAATAASAYSIWTSLPEGLQEETQFRYHAGEILKGNQISYIQQLLQLENKDNDKHETESKIGNK